MLVASDSTAPKKEIDNELIAKCSSFTLKKGLLDHA